MIQQAIENDFNAWRSAARDLIAAGVKPDDVLWLASGQNSLFAKARSSERNQTRFSVSQDFLTLAEAVACFDAPERWSLLYRLLYRTVFEHRELLQIESDRDVRAARLMEKAVNRDVHKFHAFVRFRHNSSEGRW